MYNKAYNYDEMWLWDADNWSDKVSPFCALSQFVEALETEHNRVAPGSGPFSTRNDGIYDGKTLSNFYQEYIDEWREKGLIFHSTEMGSVCWTAMLRPDVSKRLLKDANVLVKLCSCDYSDPAWNFNNLKKNEPLLRKAIENDFSILFICPNGVNKANIPLFIMQEFSVIWNIRFRKVYLDVSIVKENNLLLSGIPGFAWVDMEGKPSDADKCIEDFYDIPALHISGRWQNATSILRDNEAPWLQDPNFNRDRYLHSWPGKTMAREIALEYRYKNWTDPGFKEIFENMGVEFKTHDHSGFQWVSFVPKTFIGQSEEKLPVVLCFQEVTYQDPHQIVGSCAAYWNYIELAASGELAFFMFALESPDDNDMFMDIVDDAKEIYPIDESRIYVTGQSHNGYFADEFVRRNHERIAACAPLSNHAGIPEAMWSTSLCKPTDEELDECSKYDMPMIMITSTGENHNSNLHCRDDENYTHSSVAYQRRLKANRCKVPTYDEIMAALHSDNYIQRNIGFPVDILSLEMRNGTECYIGDVVNVDGKRHFRLVMLGNQTHFIAPEMPELSWEFMRRFKRNLETGEIIELY